MDSKELLNKLYVDNGLAQEDVHSDPRGFKIITRRGIEKIQAKNNIQIRYDIIKISDDHKFVIIKANATMGDVSIETFGEASPSNTRQTYPIAIAEKRALSRAILKVAGLYKEGIFGEDEADDFKITGK